MKKKVCNAEMIFGDDYGDNPCTFRCGLPAGHSGPHEEKGTLYGKRYILKWWEDKVMKNSRREIE